MTLAGNDPRRWDLNQLLAAFEVHLRQNSKDDAAWRRTHAVLTAEPKEVRDERRRAATAGRKAPQQRQGMSVDDAESLLARFAASEAQFTR